MSTVNKASLLTDKDVFVRVLFTTYTVLGYVAIGRAYRNAIASAKVTNVCELKRTYHPLLNTSNHVVHYKYLKPITIL